MALTEPIMISLTVAISTVLGCGVMPAGQGSTIRFNVAGFTTLPIPMVYSPAPNIQARFPGIAPNEAAARGFVERLVMQAVFDVLERQGRSALLPDAVISSILGQLNIRINYTPMNCQMSVSPADMLAQDMPSCLIVGKHGDGNVHNNGSGGQQ
ncbi:hypothetical protein KIN20_025917 [Parelaphostrongylus tenuis]|uniref:Uncharacterized protein n=1 Tax=Parelaphostrongylus tenuis TaxID=148309 RepID=A0AAD5NDI6_PARTN|nr:hypothetical protein KIN20_025917 [Parelaphostrongylus tenuis]